MSKLQNQYEILKKKDENKIYLFKVGIFYNILNEDAKTVSKAIGLKLTDLGPNLIKCGFPVSNLEKNNNLLKSKNLDYEVVSASTSSESTNATSIIQKIKKLDMNNTTYKQAFDFLYKLQNKLNNIE